MVAVERTQRRLECGANAALGALRAQPTPQAARRTTRDRELKDAPEFGIASPVVAAGDERGG
jgi:hypothetical protein